MIIRRILKRSMLICLRIGRLRWEKIRSVLFLAPKFIRTNAWKSSESKPTANGNYQ